MSDFPEHKSEKHDSHSRKAWYQRGGEQAKKAFKLLPLMIRLSKAVAARRYTLAGPQMAALLGTMGYVVSPVDLIPDLLIGGLTDDAAMVVATATYLAFELTQFAAWEKANA